MIVQAILFYVFAAVAIAAGVLVVSARNPVHSVLFLILAFFNSAGLFILIGAEFLAMILIIVYVGAVAVLFLFVVMMLDIDFAQLRSGFMRYLPVGALIGLLLMAELILVVGSWVVAPRGRAQYAGARRHPLYPLFFRLRGRRADPPGRDDRRDRADLAPARRRAPPEDRGAARPRSQRDGRGGQGPARPRRRLGSCRSALPII
jgi:NADH:ubiquinone oxidoreductase subunit 6 (subunit J)